MIIIGVQFNLLQFVDNPSILAFYNGTLPLLHTTRYGPDGLFRLSPGLPAKTLETSQRVQNLLGLVSCGDQGMINA